MNKERFTQTALSLSELRDKSAIKFPEPKTFTLAAIARGILFVFAGWSGSSVQSWKALTRALRGEERIDLSLIDADELPTEFVDRELAAIPQGNGETYWIRNGIILHFISKYGDDAAEAIRTFTKQVAAD